MLAIKGGGAIPAEEDQMLLQRFVMLLSAAAVVTTIACGQSDPGITTAVKTKLAADNTVKAYQINVDTRDHVVTLTGTVDTSAAKDQAIVIARQTSGVRDVVDQITVSQTAATAGSLSETAEQTRHDAAEQLHETTDAAKDAARDAKARAGEIAEHTGEVATDAAVTSAVKAKLLADPAVSGLKINVDTSHGVVTLKGTVASRAEADRAMAVARQTDGVKQVVNDMRVGG